MIDFKKKMDEIERKESNDNFSHEDYSEAPQKKKRRKITFYIIVFLAMGLIFSGKVIMSSQSTSEWFADRGLFNTIRHLVPIGEKALAGEKDDRINILLLGMGGEGHDGAYLTDTMILASLKPSTKQVSLVSIPRDLTVPIEGEGWRKINHVNALAVAAGKDGGLETIKTLSDVFQLPIHYYIRVDFQGFINVIDEIGGIEVDVENTFNDYAYPIFGEEDNPNYYARFEHLYIEKGPQKMDGSLALKYARSRHAYGIEGSDFARAKRQQLVIQATKDKLLSRQTLLNPVTLSRLIGELNQRLTTNLEVWEMIKLWNTFKDTNQEQIVNKVLSDAPGGLLVSSISSAGAYILTPVSGNFGEIRIMMQTILDTEEDIIADEQQAQENKRIQLNLTEAATIAVKNGTWVTGLAGKTATMLEEYGLTISEISNAPERDQSDSLIFDFTYGNKNEILNALKTLTGASQSFTFPSWINEYQTNGEEVDFILLLGTDANY